MQVYDPKTGIQREVLVEREVGGQLPVNPVIIPKIPVAQLPGNNPQTVPLVPESLWQQISGYNVAGINVIVLVAVVIVAYVITRRS